MAHITLTEEKFWELIEEEAYGNRSLIHENFEVSKSWTGTFNGLNTSSLYTFLIKEAGRLCDSYASDLFIDLKSLDKDIAGEDTVLTEQDEYRWVIGIRDMGVDHWSFLKCRMEERTVIRNYRKIYFLKIEADEEKDWGRYFNLNLYEVSVSGLDYALRQFEYPWNTLKKEV